MKGRSGRAGKLGDANDSSRSKPRRLAGWLAGSLPEENSTQQDSHQLWTFWRWFAGSAAKQSVSSAEKIIRSFFAASDNKKEPDSFQSTADSSVLLNISQDPTYTFGLKYCRGQRISEAKCLLGCPELISQPRKNNVTNFLSRQLTFKWKK